MEYLWIIGTLLCIVIGIPVAFAILFGVIVYIWQTGQLNPLILATRAIMGFDSFVMLAIPFFILSSNIMSKGGMASRLINFANILVGHIRGGFGHVNVLTSVFFAGMSGTASADVAGLGQIEIPAMIKDGYTPSLAAVVTAVSSTVGPIIPPSVPFVIYGALTGTSIGKLFLGGAIPGFLSAFLMMVLIYFIARRHNYGILKKRATLSEFFKAFKKSFLALLTPIIIILGIFTGIFTPTEASVVAVFYSLIVTLFIYKEITVADLPRIIYESLLLSGQIMLIIAVSSAFGWIMLVSGLTGALVEFIVSISSEVWVVLLFINAVLILLGCFVEVSALLIMLAPMFMPLITSLHLDPVHFGVMLTFNLMIGLVTPPVGLAMYISCGIAKVDIKDFARDGFPFYLLLIFALLLITYCPIIVMFLPNLLMPSH